MKEALIFLALGDGEWTLMVRPPDGEASSAAAIDASGETQQTIGLLVQKLEELGCAGQEITLGVSSNSVVSAPVERGNLPRNKSRQVMVYRFEEQLPIEAESLTVVFLPATGSQSLGLAVETEPFARRLAAFDDAGIEIGSICPTRWLTLWQLMRDAEVSAADYVLLRGAGQVDVFRFVGGRPYAWYTTADDPSAVVRCIQVDRLNTPLSDEAPPVIAMASDADEAAGEADSAGATIRKLRDVISVDIGATMIDRSEVPLLELACEAAVAKAADSSAGWVEFRVEGLARKSAWGRRGRLVQAAAVLGVVFMLTLIVGLWVRGSSYAGLAEQYQDGQVEQFRRLYPDPATRVPTDITSRLQSEHRRYAAVSGGGSDGMPSIPDALDTLRQTVTGLPNDVKYRVSDLRITPGGVVLHGQTLSHSDAESVSSALGRSVFRAQSPRTESLPNGHIRFSIDAELPQQ